MHYSSDSNIENDKFLSKFEESVRSLSVEESLPINNQTIQKFLSDDTKNTNDSLQSPDTSSISDLINKGNSFGNLGNYEEAIVSVQIRH